MNSAQPHITYLVKGGRESRLNENAPSELLYGFRELRDMGVNVHMVSDHEVDLGNDPSLLLKIINILSYWLCGVPGRALWHLLRNRAVFSNTDAIFVTTNTFGVCLGVLQRLGLIKSQIIYLAMGLVEPSTPKRWQTMYRWALGKCRILALAHKDAQALSCMLGNKVPYLPFGVDHTFWTPGEAAYNHEPYALSIGNDRHRDYETLIKAWQPEFPKLKIITKLPVQHNAENIELIRGDWHQQALSDEKIREIVRGASFTILPIANTVQPSGQSAALQSMACAKPVFLTDFPGLWNREIMRSGETCILIGVPKDDSAITQAIANALKTPEALQQIGQNARNAVENDLNCIMMANHLKAHMETAIGRSLCI